MEEALGYAILASPLLLLPGLLQRRWSKRRAIACFGLFAGALTALYASIDWGGSPDERITQGVVTLYGMTVSGVALAAAALMSAHAVAINYAALMFMMNPPKPADDADRG